MTRHFTARKYILLSLFLVTPAGFLFKFHEGPGQWWFRDYGAGVLYEVFWILAAFLVRPDRSMLLRIPAWVFLVTCFLEVLQLWHPWPLEQIRSTFTGRTLLGTTFSPGDFPHYLLGCLLGWLWMRTIFLHSSTRTD